VAGARRPLGRWTRRPPTSTVRSRVQIAFRGRAMDVFIARRPVFDRLNKVFGYKLVHSTVSDPTEGENTEDSALQLIDNSLLLFDFETLSAGKKLFFTFTEEALDSGCAELLPADKVVLDLHPSV